MSSTVLVAGGAGFIGSAFVRLLARERPEWAVIVYDKLTYAGNLANLQEVAGAYTFIRGDIADAAVLRTVLRERGVTFVVNFAAETHVDRSIMSGREFIETDVLGTYELLAGARAAGVSRIVQVSTDEVYGSLLTGAATEDTPLVPSNPYSASKAAGDLQALAAHRTYNLPVLITRGSNTYGPYQYPEKVIPLFITNLLEGKKVPLYGDGRHRRDWLHVDDHARGILAVLERGTAGSVYNLGSAAEVENLELTKMILRALGRGEEWIEFVPDRPGHDRRYALNSSRARALGWEPGVSIHEGLRSTIEWFQRRTDWWQPLKVRGAFKAYYQQQYEKRPAPAAVAEDQRQRV